MTHEENTCHFLRVRTHRPETPHSQARDSALAGPRLPLFIFI